MGTLTVLRLCSLTHNQLWCTLFLNFSSVWTTVARLFGPHGHFWPMTMSVVHHCNVFGPVLMDTDYCSLGDALAHSSGHHSLALVRLTHTLTLTHFSCFYHINSENKMFACFISFNFSTIQFFAVIKMYHWKYICRERGWIALSFIMMSPLRPRPLLKYMWCF